MFWLEDEAYIQDIEALGYQAAVLASLRVHHTGGPYYSIRSRRRTSIGGSTGRGSGDEPR